MAVATLNSLSSSRDLVAPGDSCDQVFRFTSSLHKQCRSNRFTPRRYGERAYGIMVVQIGNVMVEPPLQPGGRWGLARFCHDAKIFDSTHSYGLVRAARAVAATRVILE